MGSDVRAGDLENGSFGATIGKPQESKRGYEPASTDRMADREVGRRSPGLDGVDARTSLAQRIREREAK